DLIKKYGEKYKVTELKLDEFYANSNKNLTKLIGKELKNLLGKYKPEFDNLSKEIKDRITLATKKSALEHFTAFGTKGVAEVVREYTNRKLVLEIAIAKTREEAIAKPFTSTLALASSATSEQPKNERLVIRETVKAMNEYLIQLKNALTQANEHFIAGRITEGKEALQSVKPIALSMLDLNGKNIRIDGLQEVPWRAFFGWHRFGNVIGAISAGTHLIYEAEQLTPKLLGSFLCYFKDIAELTREYAALLVLSERGELDRFNEYYEKYRGSPYENLLKAGILVPSIEEQLKHLKSISPRTADAASKAGRNGRASSAAALRTKLPYKVRANGHTLLTDISYRDVHTTSIPQGKRVAVVGYNLRQAKMYTNIHLQQLSAANNRIRYFSLRDTKKFKNRLKKFNPEIIFVPSSEDKSRESRRIRSIVRKALTPLDVDGSKTLIGYDGPQRIFNYNFFCPLTKEQWPVVMKALAAHVSQMERVAFDKTAKAQAQANAYWVRALIEPKLSKKFEYMLMYKLRTIENGQAKDYHPGTRFIYHPSDVGALKSFWPATATVLANSPHPDDTEIALGGLLYSFKQFLKDSAVTSYAATVGQSAVIKGVRDDDYLTKTEIRRKETLAGAAALGIHTEFLKHPETPFGLGLPFYFYKKDKRMSKENKQRLQREEEELIAQKLREAYKGHKESNREAFILCNPEESDNHPTHILVRDYWRAAAKMITEEKQDSIFYLEYASPWAGDFNAFASTDNLKESRLQGWLLKGISQKILPVYKWLALRRARLFNFKANAFTAGEPVLEKFGGTPPVLPKYVQRFKIEPLTRTYKNKGRNRLPQNAQRKNILVASNAIYGKIYWHHKLSGRLDSFSFGTLLHLLSWLRIYTLGDVIKAMSYQQRKISFINEGMLNKIETATSGKYEVIYLAHRDSRLYQKGVDTSAEPKNIFDMLKHLPQLIGKYGIDTIALLVKRIYLDLTRHEKEKCLLCSEHLPFIQKKFNWGKYRLLIHPFAWAKEHCFVVAARAHDGKATELIDSKNVVHNALNFVKRAKGVTLVLNSLARSIPEHFHFQGAFVQFPIIKQPVKVIKVIKDGLVGRVSPWPVKNTVIKGKSQYVVEDATHEAVLNYIAKGYPAGNIDAFFTIDNNQYVVFLFPRTSDVTSQFGRGWGPSEMAGRFKVLKKEDFKKAINSVELIEQAMRETGVPLNKAINSHSATKSKQQSNDNRLRQDVLGLPLPWLVEPSVQLQDLKSWGILPQ
ncbi:MAG: DUF4922 domain-containing protein, partial [Candidatus Omnitrophota bacterium]